MRGCFYWQCSKLSIHVCYIFNVIPLKKTGAEVIDLVREMGKWNPIFCIPVGDDPDIVRNSNVLPNYHVYCIWQNVNFECIGIWCHKSVLKYDKYKL